MGGIGDRGRLGDRRRLRTSSASKRLRRHLRRSVATTRGAATPSVGASRALHDRAMALRHVILHLMAIQLIN